MARRLNLVDTDTDTSDEENIEQHQKRRVRHFRERINMEIDDFEGHFRLTRQSAEEVILRIGAHIEPVSLRNYSLSAREQLLSTLQFYGSDGFYRLIGLAHGVSTQSVCNYIP